jgi:hypothetical protein
VAARLKLEPTQLAAIESGAAPLGGDGRSRSIARSMARAIGADPQAAAAHLGPVRAGAMPRARSRRVFTGAATSTAAIATLIGLVAGLWGAWSWLAPEPEFGPRAEDLVYRPDYVGDLLTDRAEGSVESERPLSETDERP